MKTAKMKTLISLRTKTNPKFFKYPTCIKPFLVAYSFRRHITLIILTFFITAIASAKCENNGIYCLSKSPILNKNGIIILEFYSASQLLIPDLNKKYPVYLKSTQDKVQLAVIETLKGEMNETQIILKPVSELIVNEIYSLQIDNLPKYERKPARYNYSSNKWEELTFKISQSVDNDIPVFKSTPREQKKTLKLLGCGPESWVYFNMAGQDKSELFVRTYVKNKATGKITTYILSIENGSVKVGRGMCSGAFNIDIGGNFEVSFQLYDQSGNKSRMTNAIAFTNPI
ncbi:hypothetical protein GXP67_09055 [Rhodocytophaga rosea]|uniref:Uncharacterized protein n=1 Tax=Rhodocytophaga rosea TaxID=2704465 RepID=A0A6C0GG39_9BACT|nr:hypothetical protein [Rhodocytophaga rosea]QHT66794.1 hypothetical protein GXP67_09055 [Rhodocytophaga rosea]